MGSRSPTSVDISLFSVRAVRAIRPIHDRRRSAPHMEETPMPLAFESVNRGAVAFGFFHIDTDMLLLQER